MYTVVSFERQTKPVRHTAGSCKDPPTILDLLLWGWSPRSCLWSFISFHVENLHLQALKKKKKGIIISPNPRFHQELPAILIRTIEIEKKKSRNGHLAFKLEMVNEIPKNIAQLQHMNVVRTPVLVLCFICTPNYDYLVYMYILIPRDCKSNTSTISQKINSNLCAGWQINGKFQQSATASEDNGFMSM